MRHSLIAQLKLSRYVPIYFAAAMLVFPFARTFYEATLTFSLVGGVASLILPNPFIPDAIRLAHLVEVGVSKVIFGMLGAWILSSPPHARIAIERRSYV